MEKESGNAQFGELGHSVGLGGMMQNNGFWDLRQGTGSAEPEKQEKQGLEMPVVHCRGGKKGEEEKQDLTGSNCSSLAEKFCKLSAPFGWWLI